MSENLSNPTCPVTPSESNRILSVEPSLGRESEAIRVLLVDAQPVIHEGLAQCLCVQADLRVIGHAGDSPGLIQLVRQFEPEVLVVEIDRPELSGFSIIRDVRAILPRIKVLVLSANPRLANISEAMLWGARGCVSKRAEVQVVCEAIRTVAREGPGLRMSWSVVSRGNCWAGLRTACRGLGCSGSGKWRCCDALEKGCPPSRLQG